MVAKSDTLISNMDTYGPVVNGEGIEYDYLMVDTEWQTRVKNLLKSELKRKGVSYAQLAEKLTEMGVTESEANIKNKISRGGFTAVFFVQCLTAAGVTSLRLEDF